MSVATAIGNFANWRERQQARRDHNPLAGQDDEDDTASLAAEPSRDSSSANDTIEVNRDVEEGPPSEASSLTPGSSSSASSSLAVPLGSEESAQPSDTEEGDTAVADEEDGINVRAVTDRRDADRVTLAELEEERELARRRTSACVLLAVFILFRLWIEALMTGDFGLLMLCLVGTSWTARWIRHNREREEELDRRIQAYMQTADDGTAEVNRRDLQMLSFQAQLALAIMESQRNMMEGGFGHPDGHQAQNQGVSDQAKAKWKEFSFSKPAGGSNSGYGSVSQEEDGEDRLAPTTSGAVAPASTDDQDSGDEIPTCTICLGEYEEGEKLVKLPCGHIYHEECVASWTTNHVRCPLCNFDLESVASED